MSPPELEKVETGIHALWGQAKASPEYDKKLWIEFQDKLVRTDQELARLRLELARFHQVRTIIQELIMEHDENVPRGTV